MNCHFLLTKFENELQEAINHPFLQLLQKNELKTSQFELWLQQDYLFALEFTRLLGSLLLDCPSTHFPLLIDGLKAIKEELAWFEKEMKQRNISLNIKIHENCKEYIDFMEKLIKSPYAIKITAVFIIEFVYEKAWSLGKLNETYGEIAKKWSNPEFSKYVMELESTANEILQKTNQKEIKNELENAIFSILIFEKNFWDIAFL